MVRTNWAPVIMSHFYQVLEMMETLPKFEVPRHQPRTYPERRPSKDKQSQVCYVNFFSVHNMNIILYEFP